MNQWMINGQVVLPVLFPMVCGLVVLGLNKKLSAKGRNAFVLFTLVAELILTMLSFAAKGSTVVLWHLTKDIPVAFHVDELTMLFTGLLAVVWLLVGVFSFEYMKHEDETEHAGEHTRSLSGAYFYG